MDSTNKIFDLEAVIAKLHNSVNNDIKSDIKKKDLKEILKKDKVITYINNKIYDYNRLKKEKESLLLRKERIKLSYDSKRLPSDELEDGFEESPYIIKMTNILNRLDKRIDVIEEDIKLERSLVLDDIVCKMFIFENNLEDLETKDSIKIFLDIYEDEDEKIQEAYNIIKEEDETDNKGEKNEEIIERIYKPVSVEPSRWCKLDKVENPINQLEYDILDKNLLKVDSDKRIPDMSLDEWVRRLSESRDISGYLVLNFFTGRWTVRNYNYPHKRVEKGLDFVSNNSRLYKLNGQEVIVDNIDYKENDEVELITELKQTKEKLVWLVPYSKFIDWFEKLKNDRYNDTIDLYKKYREVRSLIKSEDLRKRPLKELKEVYEVLNSECVSLARRLIEYTKRYSSSNMPESIINQFMDYSKKEEEMNRRKFEYEDAKEKNRLIDNMNSCRALMISKLRTDIKGITYYIQWVYQMKDINEEMLPFTIGSWSFDKNIGFVVFIELVKKILRDDGLLPVNMNIILKDNTRFTQEIVQYAYIFVDILKNILENRNKLCLDSFKDNISSYRVLNFISNCDLVEGIEEIDEDMIEEREIIDRRFIKKDKIIKLEKEIKSILFNNIDRRNKYIDSPVLLERLYEIYNIVDEYKKIKPVISVQVEEEIHHENGIDTRIQKVEKYEKKTNVKTESKYIKQKVTPKARLSPNIDEEGNLVVYMNSNTAGRLNIVEKRPLSNKKDDVFYKVNIFIYISLEREIYGVLGLVEDVEALKNDLEKVRLSSEIEPKRLHKIAAMFRDKGPKESKTEIFRLDSMLSYRDIMNIFKIQNNCLYVNKETKCRCNREALYNNESDIDIPKYCVNHKEDNMINLKQKLGNDMYLKEVLSLPRVTAIVINITTKDISIEKDTANIRHEDTEVYERVCDCFGILIKKSVVKKSEISEKDKYQSTKSLKKSKDFSNKRSLEIETRKKKNEDNDKKKIDRDRLVIPEYDGVSPSRFFSNSFDEDEEELIKPVEIKPVMKVNKYKKIQV